MRRALLAVVLLLAGCNTQPPPTSNDISRIVDLTTKSASLVQTIDRGAPAADIQVQRQQLLDALMTAKTQISAIETRIVTAASPPKPGEIKPVDISACIGAHTSSTHYAEALDENAWATWLFKGLQCAAMTHSYLKFTSDKQLADDVGFAIEVIYPVALAEHVRTTHPMEAEIYRAVIDSHRAANQTIIAKLAPECREWKVRKTARLMEVHYECSAYNGTTAHGTETYEEGRLVTEPMDRKLINARATRLTSRAVAMAVQPKLEALTRALSVSGREGLASD